MWKTQMEQGTNNISGDVCTLENKCSNLFSQELVALDPGKSADLVVFHFTEEVRQIMSELQVNVQTVN